MRPARAKHVQRRGRDEEDLFNSGLTCQDISPHVGFTWVVLQFVGLVIQWFLWTEVKSHLDLYEQSVAEQCSPEDSQHGVCLGPMWSLLLWEDVALEGHPACPRRYQRGRWRGHGRWRKQGQLEAADGVRCLPPNNTYRIFEFRTRSSPPTFLVNVDPISRARQLGEEPPNVTVRTEQLLYAPWSLKLVRVDPPQALSRLDRPYTGQDSVTIADFSNESMEAMARQGFVAWQANLSNRGSSKLQTRFLLSVEDSKIPHLLDIHSSSQCSFTRAWKAFNQQGQGSSHEAFSLSCSLLGWLIPITAAATYIVLIIQIRHVHLARRHPDRTSGCGFHCIVVMKFFIVDLPQQVCIVIYILGWYEAEGLRCQLCLFHPYHCEADQPLGPFNCVALGYTLLSSISNQLLVRPAWKRGHSEEDACTQCTLRAAALCVSTLPLTTGVLWATSAVLAFPTTSKVLVFAPCCIGWLTLAGILLCWLNGCCEDEF